MKGDPKSRGRRKTRGKKQPLDKSEKKLTVEDNGSSAEAWSDAKKWRMDLLKSVLVFIIVSTVTLLTFDEYSARVTARRTANVNKITALDTTRKAVLDASLDYHNVAHDAFRERKELGGNYPRSNKPPSVRRFEDFSIDILRKALAEAEVGYPSTRPYIEKWRSSSGEMYEMYEDAVGTSTDDFDAKLDEAQKDGQAVASHLASIHRQWQACYIRDPNAESPFQNCKKSD